MIRQYVIRIYHNYVLGDFQLSTSQFTFNSSNENSQICAEFSAIDDAQVEFDELFTFQASAANSRDYFMNGTSLFQFFIYDNDGKKEVWHYAV